MFKRTFQGFCFYLIYGGITFAVCAVLKFVLSYIIPYFFYKDEVIGYSMYAIRWIMFILLYGIKYVENWGYLDEYDHIFDRNIYFRQMFYISLMALIIPILTAIKLSFVSSYLWVIFYKPHAFITDFINNWLYNTIDPTQADSILIGIPVVLALNYVALIPFYYLGRKHRTSDIKNSRHVSMQE